MINNDITISIKQKVLIIEDDKDLVMFIKELLEIKGYDVDYCYDGANVITLVKRFKPDIILLDIMMPTVSGYKVAKTLKNNEETKFIPIIMVTAKSETTDKVRGINCGIDDYLMKPFDSQELLARIRSLLSKKKSFEQFTEGEKIRTLRDVVASVNHEINNPLTSILIAVDSLLIKLNDNDYIREKLSIIKDNSIRIRDIVT